MDGKFQLPIVQQEMVSRFQGGEDMAWHRDLRRNALGGWGERACLGRTSGFDRCAASSGNVKAQKEESHSFSWYGVLTTEKKLVTITKN